MKKIILISLILLAGCTKMEIEPTPPPTNQNIFSVKESTITDGQIIQFDLPSDGIYMLTYTDISTDQVISRERFTCKGGKNLKKIYTKTIMPKYLYLILTSENKTQISKTKLIIN